MPMRWNCIAVSGLCVLIGMFAVGCGQNTEGRVTTTPVSGKVSFGGKPLEEGTISFMPIDGTSSATGEIQDGAYSLTTYSKGDGVPPGEYKVAISAWSVEPEMGKPGTPAIPQKYFNAEASGLTATVSKQSQTIDFDLPSE